MAKKLMKGCEAVAEAAIKADAVFLRLSYNTAE